MQVAVKTTSAPAAPKSDFGRFVLADVKKGEAAHAFRLQMIAAAIMEGYKGNPNGLTEAVAAAQGKSTIARAYQAGLAALPTVTKLPYVGAWTRTENADLRKQAHDMTDEAVGLFGAAFDAVVTGDKADAKAKRDAKKAELEAKAKAEAEAAEPEMPEAPAASPDAIEVDIATALEAVIAAVQQGVLDDDELVMLRLALAGADEALPALLGSSNPLLTAQAH